MGLFNNKKNKRAPQGFDFNKPPPKRFTQRVTATNKLETGRGSVHTTKPIVTPFQQKNKNTNHIVDMRGNKIVKGKDGRDVMS